MESGALGFFLGIFIIVVPILFVILFVIFGWKVGRHWGRIMQARRRQDIKEKDIEKKFKDMSLKVQMSFIESIKTCFSKYFVFSGRATPSEFWNFYKFLLIVELPLPIIILVFSGSGKLTLNIFLITVFATLFPFLSVISRRLHDVNRSGWWWLLIFTIIGFIPLWCWWLKPSDTSTNKYGSKPAK